MTGQPFHTSVNSHPGDNPSPGQAQWDPMTQQWVHMGPLLGLLPPIPPPLPYPLSQPIIIGADGKPILDPRLYPNPMDLLLNPSSQMQNMQQLGADGGKPANSNQGPGGLNSNSNKPKAAPGGPEKVTLTQTFSWQDKVFSRSEMVSSHHLDPRMMTIGGGGGEEGEEGDPFVLQQKMTALALSQGGAGAGLGGGEGDGKWKNLATGSDMTAQVILAMCGRERERGRGRGREIG